MPNTVETNAIFRVSTKPIHAVEHVKSNKGYTVQTGYACGSITLQSGGHKDSPKKILESINLTKKIGFNIKVNMVVKKGVNENQIIPMAKYFKDRQITLRRKIKYRKARNNA